MEFKDRLEEILTVKLRVEQPNISAVTISVDGNFAIYNVKDRYQLRKLSPAAKEFLRSGDSELIREAPLLL